MNSDSLDYGISRTYCSMGIRGLTHGARQRLETFWLYLAMLDSIYENKSVPKSVSISIFISEHTHI